MNPVRNRTSNEWDANSYDESHSFVYEYGQGVVELLDPTPDERILDVGCGTGHLTNEIAATGATVVGIDASEGMVKNARDSFSDLQFVRGDARKLPFEESFDAVFSNAALHWVREQDTALRSIADVLRPRGRFVAELGGSGNVQTIVDAIESEVIERGYDPDNPWYFPTVGEYATKLETHGFEVRHATLFDRPTELEGGDDGLKEWITMFGDSLLSAVPDGHHQAIRSAVEDRVRDELFEDGVWTVNYRRLRVVAVLKNTPQ